MKKILIIIAIVVIVLAAAAYGDFLYVSSPSGSPSPAGGNSASLPAVGTSTNANGSAASDLPDYIGTASQLFPDAPTSSLLALGTSRGTVMVSNFYRANPAVVEGGDMVIVMAQNYRIVYDPLTGRFWLAITGTPFVTWRVAAEQDFLNTLQITEVDACKLDVTSGVIYEAGNPLDGQSFPLSFCG